VLEAFALERAPRSTLLSSLLKAKETPTKTCADDARYTSTSRISPFEKKLLATTLLPIIVVAVLSSQTRVFSRERILARAFKNSA
tara:strand:- start:494 stop:748 length:255 start_codon:yes stop_codon:yes gene_type:complete